jgi:hypothetical protein
LICHDKGKKKGKTHLRSSSRRPRTLKLGSIGFLFLALALAVASGDMLLVLAVGSAIAGIVLLSVRGAAAPAHRRQTVVPVQEHAILEHAPVPARARRAPGRMAVRR